MNNRAKSAADPRTLTGKAKQRTRKQICSGYKKKAGNEQGSLNEKQSNLMMSKEST
jgi:hypothetical protein